MICIEYDTESYSMNISHKYDVVDYDFIERDVGEFAARNNINQVTELTVCQEHKEVCS